MSADLSIGIYTAAGIAIGAVAAKLLSGGSSSPKTRKQTSPVTLYYYYNAGFTGRVEGAMMLLEDIGQPYKTSDEISVPKAKNLACFAPPFCKDEEFYMSQSTAICLHLGMKYGLAPLESLSDAMRAACNAEDFWGEVYRPIKGGKDREAGAAFAASDRFTKWLMTLEAPLITGGGPYLFGSSPIFADYHLLSTLRAVEFMYPKAFAAAVARLSALSAWLDAMNARPGIVSFIKSERCLPLLYAACKDIA